MQRLWFQCVVFVNVCLCVVVCVYMCQGEREREREREREGEKERKRVWLWKPSVPLFYIDTYFLHLFYGRASQGSSPSPLPSFPLPLSPLLSPSPSHRVSLPPPLLVSPLFDWRAPAHLLQTVSVMPGASSLRSPSPNPPFHFQDDSVIRRAFRMHKAGPHQAERPPSDR